MTGQGNAAPLAAFVHIPKTGGTSICAMFRSVLFNAGHCPLSLYRQKWIKGGQRELSKFGPLYKFSFVRNPWDRYASYFQHFGSNDMAWFVKKATKPPLNMQNPTQMFGAIDDSIDRVFQFEHFGRDVAELASDLGIDTPAIQHLNQKETPSPRDWRDFYNEKTREMVAVFGAWEIERFGYGFDDCAAY